MIRLAILTISLVLSSVAYADDVAQEFNTTTRNINNTVLIGQPAICILKPIADKLAQKDKDFDSIVTVGREKDTLISKLKDQVQALKDQVQVKEGQITARDNRDLARKEYEEKLLLLTKSMKDGESSRWSRGTYFWLGNIAGALQGFGLSWVYSRFK